MGWRGQGKTWSEDSRLKKKEQHAVKKKSQSWIGTWGTDKDFFQECALIALQLQLVWEWNSHSKWNREGNCGLKPDRCRKGKITSRLGKITGKGGEGLNLLSPWTKGEMYRSKMIEGYVMEAKKSGES